MHVGPLLDLNEVMSRTEGNQRPQCFNSKCPHGCLTIVALMWHHICVLHAQSFVSINEQDTACEESSGRNLFAHMMGNVSQDQRTGNTGLFRAVSSSPVAGNWFTMSHNIWHLGDRAQDAPASFWGISIIIDSIWLRSLPWSCIAGTFISSVTLAQWSSLEVTK